MPTKAELQATVNDLTRQLKKMRENARKEFARLNHRIHVEEKASNSHYLEKAEVLEKLESVSKDNSKLLDQLKHVEDENNKLRKELNTLRRDYDILLEENKRLDSTNPIDAEVKLRNIMRAEIADLKAKLEFVQDEYGAVVKKNKELNEKCKTLGDQINTTNGVAPPQPKDPSWFNPDEQIPDFTAGIHKLQPSPEMMKFASGAVRSSDADGVRFDLITPVGLRRLAETYKEGSIKYGDNNWQKGFPASDVMNHAIRHMYLWLDGDRTEDHLAHASWGMFTIMHFEERKPECIDVTSRNPQH